MASLEMMESLAADLPQNGNGNNQHSDVLSPPLSDGPPSPTLVKSGQNLAKNATNGMWIQLQIIMAILVGTDVLKCICPIVQ